MIILALLFSVFAQGDFDCDSPLMDLLINQAVTERESMRDLVLTLEFIESQCNQWVFENVEETELTLPAGAYVFSALAAEEPGFLYADGCGEDFILVFPPGRLRHALVELPRGCDNFMVGVEEPLSYTLWIRALD